MNIVIKSHSFSGGDWENGTVKITTCDMNDIIKHTECDWHYNEIKVYNHYDKTILNIFKQFFHKTKISKFAFTTYENTDEYLEKYSFFENNNRKTFVIYIIPFEKVCLMF